MVEKILSASASVAALFVVLGLLVSVLYSWIGRRTARAIDAAAGDLGLVRARGGRSNEAPAGLYEGVIDGVFVRMASAWRFVRPIASRYAAYVSEVSVTAALPRPLPFRMEIRRRGVAMPRTLTLLDREFDRVCAILTDDAEAARDVLAPPALRREIRSFLESRVRVSRISSKSADTTVFDAHTKGASALTVPAPQAASLARALSMHGTTDTRTPGPDDEEVIAGTGPVRNLVTILESNRIRIEKMTGELRAALWRAAFRPSRRTVGVSGETEMIRAAELLAAGGALFAGDYHGWPPADVLRDLRERGRFPAAFTEVRFRGPGQPVLTRHRARKPSGPGGSISAGDQP